MPVLNPHLSVVLFHVIVLSLAALRVIPPPVAVSFVGDVTLPKITFISSTSNIAVLIIV